MSENTQRYTENREKGADKKVSIASSALQMGKIPPQALDMEEAVLGAILLEKNALHRVMDILRPNMFYKDSNKVIFETTLELFQASEPIDLLTVKEALRKRDKLKDAGGAYYLAELTSRVASAANIEYHARIIAEKSILRELIRISDGIITEAYDETTDVFDLLDKSEQNLFEVSESNLRRGVSGMGELIIKALGQIEDMMGKDSSVTGIPSGFIALDQMTAGWQKTDMVIIAARPAMGKCLGKGTQVLMFDGSLRKVEDIVEGDLLMGDDSTPRTVLSIARGRERMYWVRQNKGIDYRVNESHILSLKRSRNEWSHKKGDVLNISVKEWLEKSPKFRTNYKGYKVPVEFPEKATPIDPYFLGLWLGDGHSYSSRITTTDEEVIAYMHEYAEAQHAYVSVYEQEGRTTNYSVTKGRVGGAQVPTVQAELRKLEVLNNKHIPDVFLVNSTENRLKLLAGLIDSDGHYNGEFNVYEITQKNEKLARQIKFLCDSLGFKTSIKAKKATIASRGYESTVWRVRFYGNLECVPVRIPHKKARPLAARADWRVTGISVEFDQEDDYYGFEIDGNHLFLLEDCTVTHNTAFVLNVARNAAKANSPVALFSLEMAATQLVQRLICQEAELDMQKVRTGRLEKHEWEMLMKRIGGLSNSPIFIDDTPALSIMDLRSKCRRLKAEKKIEMVIIDYLQLMRGPTSKAGNREQEIAAISRALKEIAKELDVCMIALSQLSRAVESRGGDKRPQLSDLRESGSIEQDADMVMFLYRPEYYQMDTTEEGESTAGLAQVLIAKQRNGPVGDVNLHFIKQYGRFGDWETMGGNGGGAYGGGGGGGNIVIPSRMNSDIPTGPIGGDDFVPF